MCVGERASVVYGYVQAVIAEMSHSVRDSVYAIAVSDGDARRAGEIALAPVPKDWPESIRATWMERKAIARARQRASLQSE